MTVKELVCINCPMGCRLTCTIEDGKVTSVKGNTCGRGKKYAETECVDPVRTVTTLVRISGTDEPLPVKTSSPISKAKIMDCVTEARNAVVTAPVSIGDVIIANVAGTGSDLIATADFIAD